MQPSRELLQLAKRAAWVQAEQRRLRRGLGEVFFLLGF
jgi:hypothetical protein